MYLLLTTPTGIRKWGMLCYTHTEDRGGSYTRIIREKYVDHPHLYTKGNTYKKLIVRHIIEISTNPQS